MIWVDLHRIILIKFIMKHTFSAAFLFSDRLDLSQFQRCLFVSEDNSVQYLKHYGAKFNIPCCEDGGRGSYLQPRLFQRAQQFGCPFHSPRAFCPRWFSVSSEICLGEWNPTVSATEASVHVTNNCKTDITSPPARGGVNESSSKATWQAVESRATFFYMLFVVVTRVPSFFHHAEKNEDTRGSLRSILIILIP